MKNHLPHSCGTLAVILASLLPLGPVWAEGQAPTAADYGAATGLLPGNLHGLVSNEAVTPHWLGASGKFWYQREGEQGPEFVIVTPAGVRSPAFDHQAIARALSTLGLGSKGESLPTNFTGAVLSDDLTHLTGTLGGKSIECNLAPATCRIVESANVDRRLLKSPDGRQGMFARADDLWLRNLKTGAETRLTTDGAPYYSWGKLPDSMLITIVREKFGLAVPPFAAFWSPNSRYFIAPQVDERSVGVDPFVEWVPSDGSRRPIYHPVRSAVSGDGKDLKLHYFIFEPASARRVAIELPAGFEPSVADGFVVGWSERRGQAFLLARTIGSKSAAVFRLDLSSGKLVKVIEESSPTRVETNSVEYHRVNIRVIGDGTELVWYSARSGWGHLYLYDAQSGALKHAITEGEWLALDIQALDEKRREIFFTGGGRERGRDPYFRLLYRASLDGRGAVTLLTPTDADHHFPADPSPLITTVFGVAPRAPLVKPEGGVFIDTSSTIGKAPVTELRSTRDGRVIATLERADASKLFQAGWRVPTRERVKAADGVTDLYAVYYAPYGDSKRARPVIDAVYGGPQVNVAPYNFHDVYASGNPIGAASLSRLGFAVVTVDGRGTTSRSRAFRDAGYTEFTRVGIEDHIAAIRELARRHPEMDAGRVGIYGWSWGGTFSAQAILSHPEFYQVAVSGAGVYDYAASYPGFESYLGIPAYADGSSTRTRPDESPKNWEAMDITHMADRLQGHLMLVSGDQDENVPSLQAFRLIDALTRANKPYDLVFLPGRTHGTGMSDGYTLKRTWDYFVEHLAGATPVPDVVVKMRTAPAEL